ncbi:MAG: HlyD family type I secretion periplasmic adaptor subunit [Gammaproteobacteria bacterium]|nr:HlyD family type I secretion periplasmic adaptor subunit [Gammaproteobacteria bacterium]
MTNSQEKILVDTNMEVPKRVGLTILFLVFGVFGVWSAVAPLDGAARAPGTVMVKSYSQVVQHLEGGIISEIMVRDGDRVTAGEPLLTIDNTQAQAQLEIANAQFIGLKAREARLMAERDKLDRVSYPTDLDSGINGVRQEIEAQDEIFRSQKAALEGSVDVLEQRIEQLQSKLIGLAALKASKEELAASFSEELADVEALLSQGFSDKQKLRELERAAATLEGEAAELSANISSTEVQIGETRLQIIQTEHEFHNDVVNQLGETQTGLNDSNERVNALGDIVRRTVVRAPVAGIVTGMQFHSVNGVIGPGTPIASIVPQNEELIVEAQVSPNDIDRVALGMEATIRFSAFGSSVPTITGKLINLSADRLVDEQTGMPYYQSQIEVTEEGRADLGNLVLLPGMPAEVFITTGSRTFLQYLFKPFTNALARTFIED